MANQQSCAAMPAVCLAESESSTLSPLALMLTEIVDKLPADERCQILQRLLVNGVNTDGEDDNDTSQTPWPLIAFLCFAIGVCVYSGHVVHKERRRYVTQNAHVQGSFQQYLKYRFGYWYAWTPGSAGIVLLLLSLSLLLTGGFLMCVVVRRPMSESMWSAWIWIANPDGGASEDTHAGRVIGLFTSVGGMLIFALLMSVISSFFEEAMQSLREGRLPVVEGNHIVVISHMTNQLTVLLEEICFAEESEGGTLIAVLSPSPKVEVEEFLIDSNVREWMKNSTIVVRSGDSRKEEALEKVAVQAARKVILISKPGVSREEADVITLTTLMTLRSNNWPCHGTCVIQCQLVRNQDLFSRIAKEGSNVLTSADFVSELLVQCSQQRGLAEVVRSVFCFEGDEFYVQQVEGIKGRTFMEVLFALPRVIMIGIMTSSGVELLPSMDRRFDGDEQLVLLAEDDSDIPSQATMSTLEQSVNPCLLTYEKSQGLQLFPPKQHTVIIVGWNEMIGAMLVELDKMVGPGSTLVIHSPISKKLREDFISKAQRRRKHSCSNLAIQHTEGPLGARFLLEELPFAEAGAIIVLADKDEDSSVVDVQTLAVSVQIQDILMRCNQPDTVSPIIIPQLVEADSEDLAVNSGILNYMMTEQLVARITACVAEVPQLSCIIDCIVKDRSCSFCIRELKEYPAAAALDFEQGVTFDEVSAAVACANEVVLGWSGLDPAEGAWEMNPKERRQKRSWPDDARLVVLKKDAHSKVSKDNSPVVKSEGLWPEDAKFIGE